MALKKKFGPALTWDQLADLYPGRARIMPMDSVFSWAKAQRVKFHLASDGTIHQIIKITKS